MCDESRQAEMSPRPFTQVSRAPISAINAKLAISIQRVVIPMVFCVAPRMPVRIRTTTTATIACNSDAAADRTIPRNQVSSLATR